MRLIFSDAYASPSFDPDRMFHVLRASDFSCYPLQRLGERLHRDRGGTTLRLRWRRNRALGTPRSAATGHPQCCMLR